jgi:hypothetical protein
MSSSKVKGKVTHVPGAPDFRPHIEELLKLTDVTSTPDARSSLVTQLKLAWVSSALEHQSRERRPPTELVTQLETSIKKTQALLRRHPHPDIGFDVCPVGDGTVSVKTVRDLKFGATVELPRNPPPIGGLPEERVAPNGMLAAINIQRVLDRLLRKIKPQRKKKRGGQEKGEKRGLCSPIFSGTLCFEDHSLSQWAVRQILRALLRGRHGGGRRTGGHRNANQSGGRNPLR